MTTFRNQGELLRVLRAEEGMSQADVAARVGVGRSTLANIEAGRESMSGRIRRLLVAQFPNWGTSLDSGMYRMSTCGRNAGLIVLELTIAYVFLDSLSPSEIVQVRRVRARHSGVQGYALGLQRSDGEVFETDSQALWGGHLRDRLTDDPKTYMRVFQFPNPLRAGQPHEFAMRTWVDRDAKPCREIRLALTMATRKAHIHLASHGPHGIARAWSFGPMVGDPGREDIAADSEHAHPTRVVSRSLVTATFLDLSPDQHCGLGWEWQSASAP